MNAFDTAYRHFYSFCGKTIDAKDFDYLCVPLQMSVKSVSFRLYSELDPSSCEEPFCRFLRRRNMLRYAEEVLEPGTGLRGDSRPAGSRRSGRMADDPIAVDRALPRQEARDDLTPFRRRFDYALSGLTPGNIRDLLAETDKKLEITPETRALRNRLLEFDTGSEQPGTDGQKNRLCHLGLAYERGHLTTVKYYFTFRRSNMMNRLRGQISEEYDHLLERAVTLSQDSGADFWMAGLDTGQAGCKYKIYLRHFPGLQLSDKQVVHCGDEILRGQLAEIQDWYREHPEFWFVGIALGSDQEGRNTVNLYFSGAD
ncbi:MAG: hypothetical protein Q4D81_04115 [Eubacteriales bacterium]|nr:hypothetical protein [Eubacteriales bacterium]